MAWITNWNYILLIFLLIGHAHGENTTQSSIMSTLVTNNSLTTGFHDNQTHALLIAPNSTDLDGDSGENSTETSCPPHYNTVANSCFSNNGLTVGLALGLSVTVYTLLIILCSFCIFVKTSKAEVFGRQNIFKKESAKKSDNFYEEPTHRNQSVFYYPEPGLTEPDVKIPDRMPSFRQKARIVIDQHMGHRTLPRSLKLTITKQKNPNPNPNPYQYFNTVKAPRSPDPPQYFNTLTKKARLNDYRTRKHSISLPKDLNIQVGRLDQAAEYNPYIINKTGGSPNPLTKLWQHTRNSSNASSVEPSKQNLDEINLGMFSQKGISENMQRNQNKPQHGNDKKTQNTDVKMGERTSSYLNHISTHFDQPPDLTQGNSSAQDTRGEGKKDSSHSREIPQQQNLGQATGYDTHFSNQDIRKYDSPQSHLPTNWGKQENTISQGNVYYPPDHSTTMLQNHPASMGPNRMVVSAVMEQSPPDENDFLPPPPDEFDYPPPPIIDDQLLLPPPVYNSSSDNLQTHQNNMGYDGRISPNTRSMPPSPGFARQPDVLPPPPTCGMNKGKNGYATVLPTNSKHDSSSYI